ncbi:hypothetical protein VTP01DRAFT_8544 [Rhizomucor pusillus]|uniref:uncharacterized protein n=1 Tax=Rhizomucor pusillus TaxID=4840 RepID=UPI0037428DDC
MTLISQAAQEYEENVRNHITANMVKKTQEYIFVRLTDENDEFFIIATVSEKKALAGHVCAVLEMEPANEINIPKLKPASSFQCRPPLLMQTPSDISHGCTKSYNAWNKKYSSRKTAGLRIKRLRTPTNPQQSKFESFQKGFSTA